MLSNEARFWEGSALFQFAVKPSTDQLTSLLALNAHLLQQHGHCRSIAKLIMPRLCEKCSSPLPYTTTVAAKTTTSSSSVADNSCSAVLAKLNGVSDCGLDMQRVSTALHRLQESNFYYEGLRLSGAVKLLQKKPVGAFLVRDSSDSRYLFALSVQTERGPTNIRIHYSDGYFRLDAEQNLIETIPRFECVMSLVDYYVKLSGTDKGKSHVWLDQSGSRDLHIQLSRPLYRRVPHLQHLCRTAVAKITPAHLLEQLPVPGAIRSFLRDYPYPQ